MDAPVDRPEHEMSHMVVDKIAPFTNSRWLWAHRDALLVQICRDLMGRICCAITQQRAPIARIVTAALALLLGGPRLLRVGEYPPQPRLYRTLAEYLPPRLPVEGRRHCWVLEPFPHFQNLGQCAAPRWLCLQALLETIPTRREQPGFVPDSGQKRDLFD